jgi:mono/diheme cytochrome c family protein
MPRYSGYDAATLRAVLDHTSSLSSVPGSRAAWKRGAGNADSGRQIFAKSCAGCHGDRGQGNTGPGLGTPGFQKVATEEFIAATVVRGRAGTPMPAFGRDSANYPRLSAQEALDVAAFVRGGLNTGGARDTTVAQAPKRSGAGM